MKKLRWQIIIILLTGLIVGVLLISQKPGSTTTVSKPKAGGEYTEAMVGSIQRLNPLMDRYNQVDHDIDRLLFNGLIKFDSRGVPQGDLAESWGITKDGLTYNFALRKDVTWHDGQPFNADDVLFTIDMIRDPSSIMPSDLVAFWNEVEVKKLDDYNVQFVLPEAFSPFLDYLSFGILPKHILGNSTFDQIVSSSFNLQPVGTGPFKLDHLVVTNSQITGIVLTINDKFFGQKPYIQKINFQFFINSTAALQAYDQGEVMGISQVPTAILQKTLNESKLSVYTGRLPEMSLVFLNLNNTDVDFFQNADVRSALMIGLNRQWIIDRILQGQAMVANSPIFPGTWAYYDSGNVQYDSDKAAKMLTDAGYTFTGKDATIRAKDNKELAFTLSYPDDEEHQKIAEAIQRDWKAIGVGVEIEPVGYEDLLDNRLVKHDYQAALVELNFSRTPDPDPYPFWDSAQITGGQNYSQWDNRSASENIEEARVSLEFNERVRLYHNFQVIFKKDLPALPLYYPVYNYAVDQLVQGVSLGPLFDPSDRFSNIENWYLVTKRSADSATTTTEVP
jgi:peptide/nickel transport system substrate-binding protein